MKTYTFKCSIDGKYNKDKLKKDLNNALTYYNEFTLGKNIISQTINVNGNKISIKVNLEFDKKESILKTAFKKVIKKLNADKSYNILINGEKKKSIKKKNSNNKSKSVVKYGSFDVKKKKSKKSSKKGFLSNFLF